MREASRFTTAYGIDVERIGNELRLSRPKRVPEETPAAIALPIPGRATWGTITIAADFDTETSSDETIDIDRIDAPESLLIRGPIVGDTFAPLGMNGQTQRLSDFLRGRGIARNDRSQIPVVSDAQGIIWVVGHRIADRVRVSSETARVLHLRVIHCD